MPFRLPEIASAEALLQELACKVKPFCEGSRSPRRSDLSGAIEKAVGQDFADGDMCAAGGWLLSHTEALICAVAAI